MYIVLANGFWAVSRKEFGRQVDPDIDSKNKLVDYIIRIEGLPDEFMKPEEITYHYTYHCDKCQRIVPEWEVERRQGCGLHNPRREGRKIEVFRNGVYAKYEIPKKTWMNPAYRIWLNNEQGLEKWRQIWRYIERVYPPHKVVPLPMRVGGLRDWTIEKEEIPFIDLRVEINTPPEELNTKKDIPVIPDTPIKQDIPETPKAEEPKFTFAEKPKQTLTVKCPECDKNFFKKSQLAMHLWTKHRIKYSTVKKEIENGVYSKR